MARNDIYVNINASSPADAIVTAQQDMTAATIPELVLGDTPTFNFYFTDNTNVWPSWAGNASYTLTWALSDAVGGDFAPASTTSTATPITGGWTVTLPLNSYDLVGLMNQKRFSQAYPVTNLWQQLRVADPSGNEVTRAMFWTPVRYRAISDTQNTESASPTGGRVITTLVSNALQSPTAAEFYAANPVPTSALGSGSNGQLFIGNGSGFVKSMLTAGTGITITNGAGAITIDATTTSGNVGLNDGTAAAPSLYFLNDTNTGLYRVGADSIGVAVNGAQLAYFDANGITVPSAGVVAGGSIHAANGNANNPSHSFSSDQDTGLFRHQPNEIGIALGGVQTGTLTAALATLTSRLSLSIGATTSALTDLLINPTTKTSGNLIDAQVGGVSKASLDYNGVLRFGGNTVAGGALRLFTGGYGVEVLTGDLSSAGYLSSYYIKLNNGSAGGVQFQTDDTRIYRSGVGSITISGTTASTSTTTGALVVGGGVGVAGAAFIGGNLTANTMKMGAGYVGYPEVSSSAHFGTTKFCILQDSTSATTYLNGSEIYLGINAAYPVKLASDSTFRITTTTDTTGAGTGALQVSGGAYVAKAMRAAGDVTSTALRVTGNVGSSGTNVKAVDANGNDMRLISWGQDNATKGTLSFVALSANSSLSTTALTISGDGNGVFAGTVATAAPTGGAGSWKLGVANSVSPTSPNRTITIDIGGTTYYIHAKTTND
mgnify:CR=1 FL=1